MVLQEYSKYSASPKIESIHELVRLVGPDLLLIYRLILHDVGLKGIGKQDLNGFKNLVHLNLSGNNIVRIEGLNHLGSTLQSLDLSCNRISKIPTQCFKDLVHLKKLYLAFNNISSLESLAQMHGSSYELQLLDLRNNEIKDIKNIQFLKGLVNLKILLFQNADKTAQNPICNTFHKEKMQQKNWRAYIKHQLPLLEQLDQIALYSDRNTMEETKDGNNIENDILNSYPELQDLIDEFGSDNEEESDDLRLSTDNQINEIYFDENFDLLRNHSEHHKIARNIEPSSVNQTYQTSQTNQTKQINQTIDIPQTDPTNQTKQLQTKEKILKYDNDDDLLELLEQDSENLDSFSENLHDNNSSRRDQEYIIIEKTSRKILPQHNPTIRNDNNIPLVNTSESPLPQKLKKEFNPSTSKRKNQDTVDGAKSTVFNHQFKKIGTFIHKHQKRHTSLSQNFDDSVSEDQQESNKIYEKQNNNDTSDVESSISYPSFPNINENLRSLPSVLSFSSDHGEVEPFPNEEREKLIKMVAELSETLGNTNAFIQQRELELANEANRRRALEEKIRQIELKTKNYKQKNKAFTKIVQELRSQNLSAQSYQSQLEQTIKQINNDLDNSNQENERIKSKLSELEIELKSNSIAKEKILSSSEEIKVIEEKLNIAQEENISLKEKNYALIQEQEKIQKELMTQKYKLKKQEELHKRSLQQQTKLISKQLGMKEEDLIQEVDRLKSRFENDMNALKENQLKEIQQITESHSKHCLEIEEKFTNEKINLLKSFKDQENENKRNYEINLEEHKNKLFEIQEQHENDIKVKDQKIEELKNENSRIKKDEDESKRAIQEHLNKIKELKDYLKKYVNQEIHARATEESLKEIIQNQATKLKEFSTKYKNFQAESKKRENALVIESETWQHKYETDISSLQSKLKMLNINLSTKDKVIEKLEKKIAQQTNIEDQFEAECKSKLEENKKSVNKLEIEIQRLTNENNIKSHIIEDRDDTIQNLKTQIESLKEQLKKSERDVAYFEDKVDRLKDDIAIAEDEQEKKRKENEEIQIELDETSRLLSKQAQKAQAMKQKLETFLNQNVELKNEIEKLKDSNNKLQLAYSNIEEQLSEKDKQMKNSIENLQKTLKEESGQYKQEIVNQQAQIKLLIEKVKKDNEEKEQLKSKLKKLRQAFED